MTRNFFPAGFKKSGDDESDFKASQRQHTLPSHGNRANSSLSKSRYKIKVMKTEPGMAKTSRKKKFYIKKKAHFSANRDPTHPQHYVYESERRAEARNSSLNDFNLTTKQNNSLGIAVGNIKPAQKKEIEEMSPLFSDLEELLQNFDEYQKLIKRKSSTEKKNMRMKSIQMLNAEPIDTKLRKMNLGGKGGSFLSGQNLKQAPTRFRKFVNCHFSKRT